MSRAGEESAHGGGQDHGYAHDPDYGLAVGAGPTRGVSCCFSETVLLQFMPGITLHFCGTFFRWDKCLRPSSLPSSVVVVNASSRRVVADGASHPLFSKGPFAGMFSAKEQLPQQSFFGPTGPVCI